MKNLINLLLTTFCLMLFTTIAFANNGDPVKSEKLETIFHNKYVKLNSGEDTKLGYLALVSYNESNEYFSLKTFKSVDFIQIFNEDGELEYQLPINNSLIHLSLESFNAGNYDVNVLFEGEEEYLNMELVIQ